MLLVIGFIRFCINIGGNNLLFDIVMMSALTIQLGPNYSQKYKIT